MSEAAGPVLVVRVGAMGDVLHALPAVAALRAQRPGASIGWVVDSRWVPLLVNDAGEGPVVTRVHRAETRLWSRAPASRETMRSVLTLRSELRAAKYAAAVDLQGTVRSAVLGRIAASPRFAGYADPREAPARWLYRTAFTRRGVHVVDQGAHLLGEALGVQLRPIPAPLPREPWAEEWAAEQAAGEKLCVLAASAGWGAKCWPLPRFAALARALHEQGFRVVANAPRADDAVSLALAKESGGLARQVVCDVRGLIALVRRASLVVGGDSGPVHLAAALGVPCVALFGPTDPARNGPWGPGPIEVLRHPSSVTSYRHVATADAGLAQIEVAKVLAAAARAAAFERMA